MSRRTSAGRPAPATSGSDVPGARSSFFVRSAPDARPFARPRWLWVFSIVALSANGAFAESATPEPSSGLVVPAPARRAPSGRKDEVTAPSTGAPSATPPKAPTHKKGPAPKEPGATLPDEVPLPSADASARRSIAEGATREEVRAGAPDAELNLLRDAEAVLFPSSVRGIEPGWSWNLPEARDRGRETFGLPLSVRSPAAAGAVSAADSAWLGSLTLPDLPVRLDRRVVTYLKFYRDSPRGRTILAIWAKKAGRFVAQMKAEMRRAGLPTDLVWLSMIESGHNPTIESPAGAMGLWQFMPQSGRMYGLTVDRHVDERRDPARSTQAAIRLLSDLHTRFGNWELAMAAYNMGYAGLSRSIAKYNTNDYWTLSRLEGGIPWETTLYVPKIFALAIVMNNRESFGLGKVEPDPSVQFDTIAVEPAVPLADVARAAGTSVDEIRALNPAYVADRLPPTAGLEPKWPVRVPRGKGSAAHATLSSTARTPIETIAVRFGDTPRTLALDYGARESDWARENQLDPNERLEPGTVLIVPRGAQKRPNPTASGPFVVSRRVEVPSEQELVFYEVRADDDLGEIAAELGVERADLGRWNSLDESARLREGMMLQLLVPKSASLERVRVLRPTSSEILVAGSAEFHEHFEGVGGKRRVVVVVRPGDTLASVGSRYGMTVGSMERVNRRARSTKLVPGESLIVYTDRSSASAATGGEPGPLEPIVAPRPELLPGASAPAAKEPSAASKTTE